MSSRISKFLSSAVLGTMLAATLSLAACSRHDDEELASLDNQLVGNESDPALTSALQDQILVDPTLSQQSNRNAVRRAQTPVQGQYPLDNRTAPVMRDGTPVPGSGCGAQFDYAMAWANRLPAAFPVFPGGRVTDAAANNGNGCNMRVVTFTTPQPPAMVLDWYDRRLAGAGYSSERQARGGDQILGGTNEPEDGAFYLIVTPRGAGSDVALFTNTGR
ncbi:MAG: hypothetical protein JWN69_1206 [Alphaproteobacteria bacterium]|nr:hypothetical protein [Alphaproteobacteria bacterium]